MEKTTHKCPSNLKVLSKEDNAKLTKELHNKIKLYLSQKYHSMISDKQYPIDSFSEQIIKEIYSFNYYNNPNDNELYRLVETKFLKTLNKYEDCQRRVLSPQQLRQITRQPNYKFSIARKKDIEMEKLRYHITKTKNEIETRRITEVRRIAQRKCEEEINKRIEIKQLEAEKAYLNKVLTVNREGNQIMKVLEEKKQEDAPIKV